MPLFRRSLLCVLFFHCSLALANGHPTAFGDNRLLATEAVNSLASGIRYRFGGTDPETGLDCSAFVARLYKEAVGGSLPRTAREINEVGTHVSRKDMTPGDLVFFHSARRGISHVGVYVGDQKFVHASRKHGVVYQSSLSEPYWKSRFSGARRLSRSFISPVLPELPELPQS